MNSLAVLSSLASFRTPHPQPNSAQPRAAHHLYFNKTKVSHLRANNMISAKTASLVRLCSALICIVLHVPVANLPFPSLPCKDRTSIEACNARPMKNQPIVFDMDGLLHPGLTFNQLYNRCRRQSFPPRFALEAHMFKKVPLPLSIHKSRPCHTCARGTS